MEFFWKVFVSIFLAELGDKTQLATFLFSADAPVPRYIVFLASASALVLSSALGVFLGSLVQNLGLTIYLKKIAGVLFVLIGIWTLWEK